MSPMFASINALWRDASPLKRMLLAGVPAVVLSLSLGGVIYAGVSGGGGTTPTQLVLAATQPPRTPTAASTNTPLPPTPAPTDTPAPTRTPAPARAPASQSDSAPDTSSNAEAPIAPAPAVFWSIRDLQPGDTITVNTPQGSFNYAVQWGQWTAPDQDFTQFVSQTGQESVTLVTCIGSFAAGHYSDRYIVRGVRI